MVKLIYLFRRRAGMTGAEFEAYWRDVHGPIGARIPGLRRLVQSRALHVAGDSRQADFDGAAELWFDDVESLLAARESEAWHLAGLDESNFLDPSSTAYLVSEERIVFESPDAGA